MHKHEIYLSLHLTPSPSDRKAAADLVFNKLSSQQLPLRKNLTSGRREFTVAVGDALAQRDMEARMQKAASLSAVGTVKAPSAVGERQAVFEQLSRQYVRDIEMITVYIAENRPVHPNFNVHQNGQKPSTD